MANRAQLVLLSSDLDKNPELTVEEIKDIIEAQVDYQLGRVTELDPTDI